MSQQHPSIARRRILQIAVFTGLPSSTVWALSLDSITDTQASAGLKAALEKAGIAAISNLGKADGFLGNAAVRIPLPSYLEKAAKVGAMLGLNQQIEELKVSMNRAAEAAVPLAKDIVVGAARALTVGDAKNILTGGETSVTEFFRTKTASPLFAKFLPIVTQTISKVGVAQQYNNLVGKLPVQGKGDRVENYVTQKSLDGMFHMIGVQEKEFRRNPVAAGGMISKVFSALK